MVVTGGTTGIGYATAAALAQQGADVIVTSRSAERARQAAETIKAEGRELDLCSMASVRNFATEFLADEKPLHVLIHNAGMIHPKRLETEDGFDAQLSVIYLGPLLLTHLLLDRLKSSAPARIINVASDLHRNVVMNFEDLQSQQRYNCLTSYSRAELAKIMHTYDLATRLDPNEVSIHALHPGGVRTQLFRNFRPPMSWLIALSNLLKRSPRSGAKTSLHLASAAQVEHGAYYVNCRPKKSSKASYDRDSWQKLRQLSYPLLGLDPP